VRWSRRGILERPSFRTPWAPWSSYITLGFLAVVLAIMCYEQVWNLIALVVSVPALMVGWFLCRGRVLELAAEREAREQPVDA
jgi:L-asparagine permease